ncbi:hypothetical protein GF337_16875 [candidate division KSB1 bacterium]|nr:hypothetical protein [candidate division KSB1 bacterium]
MKILAFNGSPRRRGNSSLLLRHLLNAAQSTGAITEEIIADEVNLKYCRGCLRCNLAKRCVIKGDDWQEISQKIIESDALIFSSPVYFHHLSAQLKKILDRFRSFIHVQITEDGLIHTPWHHWQKKFVLILSLGSPVSIDAAPAIDLFKFLTTELGPENSLETLTGTRLAIAGQVALSRSQLRELYPKLKLSTDLVDSDYERNQELIKRCSDIGNKLGSQHQTNL